MKPTLKQIFDFGLEVVEKENVFNNRRNKESTRIRFSKRYFKQAIVYSCIVWFNYSKKDVAKYMNIIIEGIYRHLAIVNKSQLKQNQAEELYNSLMYYKKINKYYERKHKKDFR